MCGLPSHARNPNEGGLAEELVAAESIGVLPWLGLSWYLDSLRSSWPGCVNCTRLNFDALSSRLGGQGWQYFSSQRMHPHHRHSQITQHNTTLAFSTMALLRRRIRCHYCNVQSRDSFTQSPRQYHCPQCDAVNHFDEVNTRVPLTYM